MKVIHVISGILRSSGGPSRSSQGLVAAQCKVGIEAWLISCHVGEKPWIDGVPYYSAPQEDGFKSLYQFFVNLFRKIQPDLIHLHGIWQPQIHLAAKVANELHILYVQSPRGMLDPWALAQKRWKKRVAWWLYQKRDLQKAFAFHVTAQAEAEHVKSLGFKQPIIISPNGVHIPKNLPAREKRQDDIKTALFLSRLHPGKGLMTLADAWGRIRPKGWRMRVVGFDAFGEKDRVTKRLAELGIEDSWSFDGPMDDTKKWQAYVDSDLFIHPSVSENFGISIAEALYAGLPVITTTGTPWEDIPKRECGWWKEPTPYALTESLRDATSLPCERLQAMGKNGHALIQEKYSWPVIGEQMKIAYEKLLKNR